MSEADRLAKEWLAAWNAHDLEAILAHYADDVVFTSPFVVDLTGRPDGTLHGKDELRDYFSRALERFPDLHFEEPRVARGATGFALAYRSVRGLDAVEAMVVGVDGRIERVLAHYGG